MYSLTQCEAIHFFIKYSSYAHGRGISLSYSFTTVDNIFYITPSRASMLFFVICHYSTTLAVASLLRRAIYTPAGSVLL